jgi:hypothetical protein
MPIEAIELHFSSTDESREDKLGDNSVIWKDVLREGRFAITPGIGKRLPFEVIAQGPSRPEDRVISMSDLIDSYDERAFEDVTIPDGHPDPEKGTDSALNNTGYVRGLRVVRKGGQHFLQAAMGFTEPDVLAKVKRGTVPNVSSGVLFNFTRKADGKKFRAALNHVALARTGWINDLEPFKRVFASDDNVDDAIEIQEAQFDDATETPAESDTGDIIWNEKDGAAWVSKALTTALNPDPESSPVDELRPQQPKAFYSVLDISQSRNLALVDEYYKGEQKRWVIPFDIKDDKVEPGPERRWTLGREALIAASDDNFDDKTTEVVTEKLNAALGELEGVEDFEVVRVSMDQRCRIANKRTGTSFEASFALLPGNHVFLSSPDEWNRVQVVNLEDKPEPKPVPQEPQKVTPIFNQDTPEGRVAAARQRRRRMIAGKAN